MTTNLHRAAELLFAEWQRVDHTGNTAVSVTQRGEVAQVEAFPEPPRVPTPVHRPDGRLYRPRKLPAAMLLVDYDEEIVGVCVMRTHTVSTAEDLALAELDRYDRSEPWTLTRVRCEWGRWRPDGDEGRRAWVRDETGLTGTPAVFFDAEQS